MKALYKRGGRQLGFTLSELLIVITVVAIILALALLNYRTQIVKGYDAQRKHDLDFIKIAFEEYYNDKGCYPPATILSQCASNALAPYMAKIPCDPITKLPYKYVPLNNDPCKGHRVLTALQNLSDPIITQLGCNPTTGCGFGPGYNYGVSSGTPVVDSSFNPNVTPTPTPPGPPGDLACSPGGICNSYSDPIGSGCPVTYFSVPPCNTGCLSPANWCLR